MSVKCSKGRLHWVYFLPAQNLTPINTLKLTLHLITLSACYTSNCNVIIVPKYSTTNVHKGVCSCNLSLWSRVLLEKLIGPTPPVPVLSQINPVHGPSHFLEIHFITILPFMPRSSKWWLSLRCFLTKTPHAFLLTQYMPLTLPISFFVIWSPEKLLVRNIQH